MRHRDRKEKKEMSERERERERERENVKEGETPDDSHVWNSAHPTFVYHMRLNTNHVFVSGIKHHIENITHTKKDFTTITQHNS